MRSMTVQDIQVIVLADDDSQGGKGGLFERFVAKLLASQYGFENPTTRNLNVTSEGIELDVVARHRLIGGSAVAECKAYTRNVRAAELTNFYGKLNIERFDDPQTFGLLCALPRLTPEGQEKARSIEAKDPGFKYLSADDLASALLQGGLISDVPKQLTDVSDRTVLITEHGVFSGCIVLDSEQRTPTQVAIWGVSEPVPPKVCDLLMHSDYAGGLPVVDAGLPLLPGSMGLASAPSVSPVLLAPVIGSSADFEYQLPASPKYFVGRSGVIKRLDESLSSPNGAVLVLNAQSGWGKSSLALKMGNMASRRNGVAVVLDTRTADQPRYVVEVLRRLGSEAETAGILKLPSVASWASLESALATLRGAEWNSLDRPILVFFDQFENVFRDVELTRAFRDLALGVRDVPGPLVDRF